MKGKEVLKKALKNIPEKSGVYRMLDKDGKILYIGKAKNLKNRVSDYTNIKQLSTRIARMVSRVENIEIVITSTEKEALLLESRLIKENKPPFNILLRDDKSFPYIMIDDASEFPRIAKHRGAKNPKRSYFGPYSNVWAVHNTIAALQKIFLIRPCSDSYFKSRKRPCMEYEIKKCSAPCVGKISAHDYQTQIANTKDFLSGKDDEIKQKLQKKMYEASEAEEFEVAAKYRNQITALSSVQSKQSIYAKNITDADVIGLAIAGGKACITIFFFRGGKILGNTDYFPSGIEDKDSMELMEHFIINFYRNRPAPKNIILSGDTYSKDVLEQILSEENPNNVKIIIPEKGEKKDITNMALANAKHSLEVHLSENENTAKILEKVQEVFSIKEDIKRIEVFDNSHIFGTNAIGGMVVAGYDEDGKWGFLKKHYRKFNVDAGEKKTGGDDFEMMRQVLNRRYGRIKKELSEGGDFPFPDLILIDGGAGQLSVATEVFEDLGIANDLNYVAIAKGVDRNSGREDFYLPNKQPFKLEPNDATLYFLQNLRDEVHRYAITGHRQKRKKNLTLSEIDEIPNIGAARKKALLEYFGSIGGIKEASVSELTKAEGISKKIAEKIYNWFR